MRNASQELDTLGKTLRTKTPDHYKIKQYFSAADLLRNAADSLEYVLS